MKSQVPMIARHKGYSIYASAIPGPPNTSYWCARGIIFKSRFGGSVVEVGRVRGNGITFDQAGMAAWYGMELGRLAIEHCLPQL